MLVNLFVQAVISYFMKDAMDIFTCTIN